MRCKCKCAPYAICVWQRCLFDYEARQRNEWVKDIIKREGLPEWAVWPVPFAVLFDLSGAVFDCDRRSGA